LLRRDFLKRPGWRARTVELIRRALRWSTDFFLCTPTLRSCNAGVKALPGQHASRLRNPHWWTALVDREDLLS